jgi:hypothetical protein
MPGAMSGELIGKQRRWRYIIFRNHKFHNIVEETLRREARLTVD